MEIETVTQGVEVEGYIRSREWIEKKEDLFNGRIDANEHYDDRLVHNYPEEMTKMFDPNFYLTRSNKILMSKVFKEPHYDTGNCTEIDTLPFDNLGDLSDNLKEVIGLVYEYCKSRNWLYMLMGAVPVSEFAGGHIHCSINPYFNKVNLRIGPESIYYKLYPYQVFISLLGQNSSYKLSDTIVTHWIGDNLRRNIHINSISNIKDTRIDNFDSGFSPHDGYEEDEGHLSPDKLLNTLEVRYPSASSFYQTIGVATFIKACIFSKLTKFQDRIPPKGLEHTLRLLCDSVPICGSQTPLKLAFKGNKLIGTTIGEVFSLLFTENSLFMEGLDRAISELSSIEGSRVLQFFNVFGSGLSMTDYYNSILQEYNEKSKLVQQCEVIHELGEDEYLRRNMIIGRTNKQPIKIDYIDLLNKKFPSNKNATFIIDARIFGLEEMK